MQKTPTFSVVLETENLGMAEIDDLLHSLDSLKKQSLPIEKANEVIVVIGSHVTKSTQKQLKKQYPWLKLYVSKKELEYTKAKMAGARIATGDIVVYADSDVTYQNSWLKNLLEVFKKYPNATVSSGQTHMHIHSAYTLSLALAWMLNLTKKVTHVVPANTFSLNNFAIKRQVFLKNSFPSLALYRGKITFWRDHLKNLGCLFYCTPNALGHHAPPATFIDWLYRMMIFGADYVATADFNLLPNGTVQEKRNIPKRIIHLVIWIGMRIKQLCLRTYLITTQRLASPHHFILGMPLAIVTIIITIAGGCIAIVNRDFLLNRIQARENMHVA